MTNLSKQIGIAILYFVEKTYIQKRKQKHANAEEIVLQQF